MIYIESALLASLCTLGIYCAYTDIRTHRIPNKAIVFAFGFGAVLHLMNILMYGTMFYADWLLEMLIGNVIACILYADQVWAPGDVKLFAACYFLLPPQILDSFSLQHAVVPFLLIFSPALIYVLMETLVRMFLGEKGKKSLFPSVRKLITDFARMLIISYGAYYFLLLALDCIGIKSDLFVSFSMLLYILSVAGKPLYRKWYVLAIHVIPLLIYWFTKAPAIGLPDWRTLLILCAVLGLKQLVAKYNYQCIPTSSVQPGMILSSDTVALFYSSKVKDLPLDLSENLSARISDKNAEAIRRWEKTNKGKPEIWIVRKIPFGVMIFIGFTAWIVIRLWR